MPSTFYTGLPIPLSTGRPGVIKLSQMQWTALHLNFGETLQVKQFKMASVYPTVWSMARLAYPMDDELLDALSGRALTRLNEPPAVEGQYVCNLLWACAKLGRRPLGAQLFDAAIRSAHINCLA